ncbi:Fic family protein [Myroides odoratimimus]|uniref:Fic family protein n=1 Tax=Myroides odoratimimus TaxID=76832 RepID=UPI001CE04C03|nr:Fic family protein [Myroides odoratimimus]MCA4792690.1 Fic family protein [Myroides odoratimimus]MCA4819868.1 Fic family protein [Myroides odoratimimus]MDM1401239.1 Fic family protein [Myroides odoratimimus]MDM1457211.1 Fic family protein [Myroides odoratimimus]MEC4085770.1 Fic family protein [Myroides odoratimimus]
MTYIETKNKIDALIQQAEANGALSQEQLRQLHHKFRLEWNYNSNSMEGNTLTVAETRSVMIGNIEVHRKPLKDILEVKGHDEVISEILRIGKAELRLSEKRIKEIHMGIMQEEDPVLREQIGQWKVQANEIINHKGEKFLFALPEEVPEKLHDLLNRTNAAIDRIVRGQKDAPHPIDVALNFHIDYLNIHPFYDGNGRTARILSNLILVALGYPPFWITEQERDVYYRYIGDIQCYGGRREDLFAFISELILRSQQMINDVQAGKSIEEADDIDKEIELLKREFKAKETDNTEIKRSNLIIKELYDKSLRSLIGAFKGQAVKFNDFFAVNKEILSITVNGSSIFNDSAVGYIESINDETESVLTKLSQLIIYEEIKVGKNLNYSDTLVIEFKNDSYEVYFSKTRNIIAKKYNEILSEEEINRMMKEWSEAMINRIKGNFRKEKGNE